MSDIPDFSAPALIASLSTKESDLIDEACSHWKYRAVEATLGHLTPLGCILLAVIGHGRMKLPRLGLTAEISADDHIFSDLWTMEGKRYPKAHVCKRQEMVDAFRSLCDQLDFTDAEREELFCELRKWIAKDHRQVSTNLRPNFSEI